MAESHSIELLAPAGSFEMVMAAAAAQTNAVYLGGSQHHARAYTESFDLDSIKKVVEFCHLRNIRVYITLNTLIHDRETKGMMEYVHDLYHLDVDALIIQDLGAGSLIRKNFPDFPLHASTQMSIHNRYGAEQIKEAGYSRVILARETPIEEIRLIKKHVNIELEIFVHGSLCISMSGQCLMSSFLGGRSGNRGKCAQPCRKNYSLVKAMDEKPVTLYQNQPLISPKDLCTYGNIGLLMAAGVDSLKIEGRMKKPEYVYAVAKNYKQAILGFVADSGQLLDVTNRGFTRGYLFDDFSADSIVNDPSGHGRPIGSIQIMDNQPVILFSKKVVKGDSLEFINVDNNRRGITLIQSFQPGEILQSRHLYDAKANSIVKRIYSEAIRADMHRDQLADSQQKVPVIMTFSARVGQPPALSIHCQSLTIRQLGKEPVAEASTKPVTAENIIRQLSKITDTGYAIEKIDLDMDQKIFLPLKTINQLRQEGIKTLNSLRSNFHHRTSHDYQEGYFVFSANKYKTGVSWPHKPELNIELDDNSLIESIDSQKARRIIVHNLEGLQSRHFKEYQIFYKLPKLLFQKDTASLIQSLHAVSMYLKGLYIDNLDSLRFAQVNFSDKRLAFHGDLGFNVFNAESVALLGSMGLSQVTLSSELNLREIRRIAHFNFLPLEVIVHGYLPLMTLRYCPMSIVKKCKTEKDCQTCPFQSGYQLQDSHQANFPLIRRHHYTQIYNSVPLVTIDFISQLSQMNLSAVRLVFLNERNVRDVVNSYYDAIHGNLDQKSLRDLEFQMKQNGFTKGHYFKGVK